MGEMKTTIEIKPKDSTLKGIGTEKQSKEWFLSKAIEKIPERKVESSTLLEQVIKAGILL